MWRLTVAPVTENRAGTNSTSFSSPTGDDAPIVATIFQPPQTRAVVLTVTAECLTALHAVCRISAALPGFSRFLVNLRLDSAAISSSERSPRTRQPVRRSAGSQSGHHAPYHEPTELCLHTRARTRITTRARRRGLSKWAETSGCDCQIKARFADRREMTAEGAFDLL